MILIFSDFDFRNIVNTGPKRLCYANKKAGNKKSRMDTALTVEPFVTSLEASPTIQPIFQCPTPGGLQKNHR